MPHVPLQRPYFGGFQAHLDSVKLFWGLPAGHGTKKKVKKKVPPLEGVTTKVNFSRKTGDIRTLEGTGVLPAPSAVGFYEA